MYSVDVSPDLISRVTDEVIGEVSAWQTWPLQAMHPVVFFDALRVKIREDRVVRAKAVYWVLRSAGRWQPRHPGDLGREHQGCRILDESLQRHEDSRGARHPDCRDRRIQRHARGNERGVPGHDTANLHRAPVSLRRLLPRRLLCVVTAESVMQLSQWFHELAAKSEQ